MPIWDGLQLGNLHKHRALHCDEEIIHYLGCVFKTWNYINFLGVDAFANAVDVDTVQRLEKLFPAYSEDLWLHVYLKYFTINSRTSTSTSLKSKG
jgi:hypothetical protein